MKFSCAVVMKRWGHQHSRELRQGLASDPLSFDIHCAAEIPGVERGLDDI
jgi:hypothetical protein